MKHRRVIGKYLAWTSHEIGAKERREVERHLDGCEECREYYRKMTRLLERPNPALLPRLEPDAFAPARIRAAADPGIQERLTGRAAGWTRASIAGATLALALAAGVYIGHGLSQATHMVQEGELAEAYYEAFSPSDFAGGWESLVGTAEQKVEEETDR